VITTRGLTKRFGRLVAVDGLDFDVREGDRFGFLGPNGSGKTTTVRMLLGLVYATSGEIEVLGHRIPHGVKDALPEVGALVEGPAAYGHLSARTNLSLLDAAAAGPGGGRRRTARIEEALEQVGLAGVGRRPVKHYSLGMRQRLGLAAALIRRPRLLILDEPTNGLDPQGIHEIRELLTRLNGEGVTLFLSSHLLSEVHQLCNRIAVVDRGRLVLQDSLAAILKDTGRLEVRVDAPAAAVTLLDGRVTGRDGDRLVVAGLAADDLARRLVQQGIGVLELAPQRRTLEQVVLSLTSHGSDRADRADHPDSPDGPVRPDPAAERL
jgi:ABC-type multidrug transport system ATPase subunit